MRTTDADDEPREWCVESRSQTRDGVASAWATIPGPGGREWDVELSGRLVDEQRGIYVESDAGSVAEPWRPAECRRLSAAVRIVSARPNLETECEG